jgi:hypothetical protein
VLLATTLFVIQIGATVGAKAAAIAAADDFHGQGEQNLLGQDVGEEKAIAFEKGHFGVVKIQVIFVVGGDGSHGLVVQIEIAADFFDDGVQAAGADHFDPGVQVAIDADLAFDELGGRADLERFNLMEFSRMKIERTGKITLPDAGFSDGEFVYVQKHLRPRFSESISIIGPGWALSRNARSSLPS